MISERNIRELWVRKKGKQKSFQSAPQYIFIGNWIDHFEVKKKNLF
jgi:hypothetical protein